MEVDFESYYQELRHICYLSFMAFPPFSGYVIPNLLSILLPSLLPPSNYRKSTVSFQTACFCSPLGFPMGLFPLKYSLIAFLTIRESSILTVWLAYCSETHLLKECCYFLETSVQRVVSGIYILCS